MGKALLAKLAASPSSSVRAGRDLGRQSGLGFAPAGVPSRRRGGDSAFGQHGRHRRAKSRGWRARSPSAAVKRWVRWVKRRWRSSSARSATSCAAASCRCRPAIRRRSPVRLVLGSGRPLAAIHRRFRDARAPARGARRAAEIRVRRSRGAAPSSCSTKATSTSRWRLRA